MKKVIRTMAITAVMGVALSLSAARSADPPVGDPGRALCFELVDGTVITGRIDAKVIAIRIPTGNVLKIPVAELKELTVGLNDRPGFVKRVESLIEALDSDKTRPDALREIIGLGPAVRIIVKRYVASKISARRDAIWRILETYKNWWTNHPGAPDAAARPLQLQSKVQAGASTLLGAIVVDEFRIASPYGPVTVKLNKIQWIRPVFLASPRQLGRRVVDLHDKTRLKGTVSRSLRILTHYGTVLVPLTRIRSAAFAADGKNIRVQCWGSDRIVGTLEPGATITLKTGKGGVDLPTRKIARVAYEPLTLKGHSGGVESVAFSPDGKRLASGSEDGFVKIWDPATGKELITFNGHSGEVLSVAFSPDGKRIASGSEDKTVRLWDSVTGKTLLTFRGHPHYVVSIAFSPDGKRMISGCVDGPIKVWDTATGKELFGSMNHSYAVKCVAFSPDGKRMASGSTTRFGTVKIWDSATGKALHRFRAHSSAIRSVAFSPDSKRLAAGFDQNVGLWDTSTGDVLLMLKGHSRWVVSVAFSPDGKRLVSGVSDKTIGLWDAVTGKELLLLRGHSGEVRSVAFSPDGKRLASGSDDKTINVWETFDWTRPSK